MRVENATKKDKAASDGERKSDNDKKGSAWDVVTVEDGGEG